MKCGIPDAARAVAGLATLAAIASDAGASCDVPGSPSITLYRDMDVIECPYVSLAGSHAFGESGVELGFTLGLGDEDHNAAYCGADAMNATTNSGGPMAHGARLADSTPAPMPAWAQAWPPRGG